MIFTHTAKLDFNEIENRLEEDAKQIGLMLKKHFAFSKMLPDEGFEIKEPASVFELCKPSVAAKVLNAHPELSIMMPCRISVYNKDGVTFVSTPDMSQQLKSPILDETLQKEMSEVYTKLMSMIKEW